MATAASRPSTYNAGSQPRKHSARSAWMRSISSTLQRTAKRSSLFVARYCSEFHHLMICMMSPDGSWPVPRGAHLALDPPALLAWALDHLRAVLPSVSRVAVESGGQVHVGRIIEDPVEALKWRWVVIR